MERLPLSRNFGRTNTNPDISISSLVSSSPPILLSLLPKLEFSKGNQLKQDLIMWHLKEFFTTVRDSQQMCCWDCPCLVLVMKKAMTGKQRGSPCSIEQGLFPNCCHGNKRKASQFFWKILGDRKISHSDFAHKSQESTLPVKLRFFFFFLHMHKCSK